MCGPAGSGKSTVARQLEQRGMTGLSFDQEAWSRGITTMPLPEDAHRDIEHVLRARLADLVGAGSDVVLDFSFWSRRMRDEYREFLGPYGVVPETVYLATDRATALRRIAAREGETATTSSSALSSRPSTSITSRSPQRLRDP
jgi:predicted kinase